MRFISGSVRTRRSVYLRCKGEDEGCCTAEEPCEMGDGDCDTHEECEGELMCGNNNCGTEGELFDAGDDCCRESEFFLTTRCS